MNPEFTVILYVDDDEDDREFFSIAIKEVNPSVEVVLAENGLKAIDYLKVVKDKGAKLPSLIVLDINMPFLDGREIFRRIQDDSVLRHVPVVVFSSSESPNDKALFRSLGIEFISKPDNFSYMNSIASHMLGVCSRSA